MISSKGWKNNTNHGCIGLEACIGKVLLWSDVDGEVDALDD